MVSLEDLLLIKENQDFYKNSKEGNELANGKKWRRPAFENTSTEKLK